MPDVTNASGFRWWLEQWSSDCSEKETEVWLQRSEPLPALSVPSAELHCVSLMLSREAEQLLLARGNLQINKLLSVKHFEDGEPCAAPQDYYCMALILLMGFQWLYFPYDL